MDSAPKSWDDEPVPRLPPPARGAGSPNPTRPKAPTLPAIRSLAYFLPVIEEVLQQTPDVGYLDYLRVQADLRIQIPTDCRDR
jgi:hypothetical protein